MESKTTEIKTSTHKDIEVIKGIRYISVTTCLKIIRKIGLEKWRGFVGNDEADRKMKQGSDRGTEAHDYFRLIDLGQAMKVLKKKMIPEIKHVVKQYHDWDFENVKETIFVEKQFYSKKDRVMGRPDKYCIMNNGKFALIDHKTGKVVDKTDYWQVCEYKQLLEENGHKVDDIYILHNCISTGKFKVIKVDRKKHLEYYHNFLYAKRLYIAYNYQ
jgi:hypothetical protein